MRCRIALALLVAISVAMPIAGQDAHPAGDDHELVIGSKLFTESVILGEVLTGLLRDAGFTARHHRELGGTRVNWNALRRGDIDAYAEYTGTIVQEILAEAELAGEDGRSDPERLTAALAAEGISMSAPLGFDNTYAVGVREDVAERLGLDTISDLREHPALAFGFSNEFMDRGDGWPSLRDHYRLPQRDVRGLDHDLAYRALEAGDIQAIDLYSTDAEIAYYGLRVLGDDLRHFPDYQAVILYRDDLPAAAARALRRLDGAIDASAMVAMNARAKLDRVPEATVATDFLRQAFDIDAELHVATRGQRLLRRTREHLVLVGVSLLLAILVALPLGIVAAKTRRFGQLVLGVVGILQTIPSLALLVFMIPLLGIGTAPALAALFLYSLLPIVRNTHAGLHDVPRELRESAEALGLDARTRLWRVELPMASRAILAGIKTSAVINIGTATLGALIGAGGYGQPILTGIRLDDLGLILEGAVPAAGLALVAQGAFELADRWLVPRGLRG